MTYLHFLIIGKCRLKRDSSLNTANLVLASPLIFNFSTVTTSYLLSNVLAVLKYRSASILLARNKNASILLARNKNASILLARNKSASILLARNKNASILLARNKSASILLARNKNASILLALQYF